LEDVDIERQILAYCKRQHKAMKKTLFNSWKPLDKSLKVWYNIDVPEEREHKPSPMTEQKNLKNFRKTPWQIHKSVV
jgi:hypothetical protein